MPALKAPHLPERPSSAPSGPRPRNPLDARTWRSPLRSEWLTSVFGLVLLIGLPIVIITGLMSFVAYGPQFNQAFPSHVGYLHLPFYIQPTRPVWLYRLTQGLHVAVGLALIPVVLAKLWSVIPRLFAFPPITSLAQAIERLSLIGLVGGVIFELVTGVLNIQYDYIFKFDFYTAHYYGAWVFIASFLVHVGIKFPIMWRNLRTRGIRSDLRQGVAETAPEVYAGPEGLAAVEPEKPTISRRGLFGFVGGASLLVTVVTVGETVPGLRWAAYLSVRGQSYGDGPTDFQINKTARVAGIKPDQVGAAYRLTVSNGNISKSFSRDELLALPQHTARLPIACVEGWSTEQTWTGVRLRDLERLVDSGATPARLQAQSLQKGGPYSRVIFARSQYTDSDAMLALQVNGVDLSLDHGFPARILVPGLPGVHQTKWVTGLDFGV